ncbi:MAG: dipicolinate synthase subunit B [Vallitaleaceae bacterium]|nr:dipicolinate synthase subunit B [Vallitaleaceae bacterium]
MDSLIGIKIGYAICGSFCTIGQMVKPIKQLMEEGAEVFPIMSEHAYSIDTRFGTAKGFIEQFESITGHTIQHNINETELIGPKNPYDALIVAPCTGNTMAKLANAITDTAVLMAIKASLRNGRPVILAIATNDALGLNLKNIGILLNTQGVYFVPFGQDDFKKKKNSMVANMDLIYPTLMEAFKNRQIQPILVHHCEV